MANYRELLWVSGAFLCVRESVTFLDCPSWDPSIDRFKGERKLTVGACYVIFSGGHVALNFPPKKKAISPDHLSGETEAFGAPNKCHGLAQYDRAATTHELWLACGVSILLHSIMLRHTWL